MKKRRVKLNPRWIGKGAPAIIRLEAMLESMLVKSKGSWLPLDLAKIASCMHYSPRHINRIIKQLRSESENEKIDLVFRSVNKIGSRGRQILICTRTWYDAHGELFDHSAENKDRGLRKSFEEGQSPIKGVSKDTLRPTDIPKKTFKKGQKIYTRNQRFQKLRRISYFYSGKLESEGLLEAYHRSQIDTGNLRNLFWKYLQLGYWREDIISAICYGLKLSHIAVTDGLAKSGFAYAVFGIEDRLKKIDISKTRDKIKQYYSEAVDIHRQCLQAGMEDFGLHPELKERTQYYEIEHEYV